MRHLEYWWTDVRQPTARLKIKPDSLLSEEQEGAGNLCQPRLFSLVSVNLIKTKTKCPDLPNLLRIYYLRPVLSIKAASSPYSTPYTPCTPPARLPLADGLPILDFLSDLVIIVF